MVETLQIIVMLFIFTKETVSIPMSLKFVLKGPNGNSRRQGIIWGNSELVDWRT